MKVWTGSAWAEKPTKVWSGSAWVTRPVKVWSGSAWVVKPPAAGGTSYDNPGGMGDRMASIVVTTTATFAGNIVNILDGSRTAQNFYWFSESGREVKFDFGTPKIIDEARWYQDAAYSNGTWQWQGSNDNAAWTNVGTPFVLGDAVIDVITELAGNTTAWRYYRMLQTAGTTSASPWIYEIEFKIAAGAALSFQDSFNRADVDLGSSLTASGGWTWAMSGGETSAVGASAQIRSNALRANTAIADGTYFTKDIGTAEHYIQFKALSTSGVGPFVIARHSNFQNQIGVRLSGASIQIFRRVSGSYTSFHSVNYGFAVNDVVKVKFTGNTCEVVKNGVSQATGIAIGATLAGTKCGLNPRQALQDPWIDDFEAGAN